MMTSNWYHAIPSLNFPDLPGTYRHLTTVVTNISAEKYAGTDHEMKHKSTTVVVCEVI